MSENISEKKLLGVVIPVYNEEDCIAEVISSWDSFLKGYVGNNFIMLLINDGSKDSTPNILDSLVPQYPNLRVMHQKNGGHGNAVLNGYHKIMEYNPEYVFQVDSDNQFLPEDFPKLWEKRNESRFILGHRKVRYDDFNRLIITRIVRVLNLTFYKKYIHDANIPYRLIKGEYLKGLLSILPDNPFAPNIFLSVLAARDGNNLMNIHVTHKERETGQVSIIKMNLLKVCIISAKELITFSSSINSRLKRLNQNK